MGADGETNEAARLRAVDRYDILDTSPEEGFDRITRIASRLLGAPIALVTVIDERRQWFKSRVGLEASETPRSIAFCDHAIRTSEVMVVPDAAADDRFRANPMVTGDPNIRFYAGAPLRTRDGHNLGTLCVIDRTPREFSVDQKRLLQDLANLVMDQMELRLLAGTDPLTGAFNRRRFMGALEQEWSRVKRYRRALAVLMLDIDHFKKVNDTWGHGVGDEALKRLAEVCHESLRSHDIFARFGGEEFGVLLPEVSELHAVAVAERLRQRVSDMAIPADGQMIRITVSVGIAHVDGAEGDVPAAAKLIEAADDALYAAIRLLALLGEANEPLSAMLDHFPAMQNTPELRIECAEARKFGIVREVRQQLKKAGADMLEIDGVRVTTSDGWWLLRASNTQPALVARAESKTPDGLERLKAELRRVLLASGIATPGF